MKTIDVKKYSIPISIVIAGALIAGSVFFSSSYNAASGNNDSFGNGLSLSADSVSPINATDHVKGNPRAAVIIVEYSDYECPFCGRVHPTLSQLVEEFDGEVKWVYRHFPLTSIHSNAFAASVASECVAKLGGNSAFWYFTEQMFANQGSLSDGLYESIALEIGISIDLFQSCIQGTDASEIVKNQMQNAIDSGGRGTPYIVVINAQEETFPFSGALPYAQIKSIIEEALEG